MTRGIGKRRGRVVEDRMNDVSWVARALGPRDATVTRDRTRHARRTSFTRSSPPD